MGGCGGRRISFDELLLHGTHGAHEPYRWSRKFVMILTDTISGLATLAVLLLYLSGHLQVWHLYLGAAVVGAFQAFQWPAYSATISVMVAKKHYGRANSMMSLAEAASSSAAPVQSNLSMISPGWTGWSLRCLIMVTA